MKITADMITDEQIRELRRDGERMLSDAVVNGTDRTEAFDIMLNAHNALGPSLDVSDGDGTFHSWRARCAEILNARQ